MTPVAASELHDPQDLALVRTLGHAGLLPFIGLAVLLWLVEPGLQAWVAMAITAYGALVASFLGGIHWGIGWHALGHPDAGVPPRHPCRPHFLWGIVPPLLAWPGIHVIPHHLWAVLWFGTLGAIFLAFIGVLTSIWAEKFDHAAAVTNFVIAPLTLLSGTFYSVDSLAPSFRMVSHLNPFFYVISGFRYGFLGVADSPIALGSVVVVVIDVVLGWVCYTALRKGWKLKS